MLTKITGAFVQYYVTCPTELWYFSHGINLDKFDKNMMIGKIISEESYKEKSKNLVLFDEIAIDMIERSRKIVYEVKKSSKNILAAKYQLLYYLYYLDKLGVKMEGIISIPKEKITIKVTLDDKSRKEVEYIIKQIPKIVNSPSPPPPVKKRICNRCSYFELCWS